MFYFLKHFFILWLVPHDPGSPQTLLKSIDILYFPYRFLYHWQQNYWDKKTERLCSVFHIFVKQMWFASVCWYESEHLELQRCDHFHYIRTIKKFTSPPLETGVYSFRPYSIVECREFSGICHLNSHIRSDNYLLKGKISASPGSEILNTEYWLRFGRWHRYKFVNVWPILMKAVCFQFISLPVSLSIQSLIFPSTCPANTEYKLETLWWVKQT